MSLITVIVSTYNSSAYLEEAVESVLNQTHKDLEFLVMDDGSSDQTISILERLSANDNRLKITTNEKNRGTGYCYSQLIALAQGDYIASIGHDDIWDSNFLEVSLSALQTNSNACVSFANLRIIDALGAVQPGVKSPFRLSLAATLKKEDLFCLLLKHNFFCAVSAVFKKREIANWQTLGDNDQLQDWETWLHLILKGEVIFLAECLVSYRIHGNNLSLNGHSPTQAQAELVHTRASVLGSEEFARFILAHSHPNELFQTAFTCISETINPNETSHYFLLLFALKKNEHLLRGLLAYQVAMSMLHLHTGAFTKANRYTYNVNVFSVCPQAFWKGFEWRFLINFGNLKLKKSNSPYIREKKIGRFRVLKFLVKRNHLPLLSFAFIEQAKSTEHLIEKHHAFTQASKKKKIIALLNKLGLENAARRVWETIR